MWWGGHGPRPDGVVTHSNYVLETTTALRKGALVSYIKTLGKE